VGGKSELHRTGRRVTPGGYTRNFITTDSATEKIPSGNHQIRVKRWGKSPPACWQQQVQGKPRPKQGQIGKSFLIYLRIRVVRSGGFRVDRWIPSVMVGQDK